MVKNESLNISKKTKNTRIISVCNGKGGVGKTTTAINTAYSMANRGYKVLLIDFGPQHDATLGLGYFDSVSPSMSDVLRKNEELSLADCIVEDVFPNLDLIPADEDLIYVRTELQSSVQSELALARAMSNKDGLKQFKKYDYIFIDNNPSLDVLVFNSMAVSDYVLIPLEASAFSAEGIQGLIKVVNNVRRINEKLKILGLVFVRVSKVEKLEGAFRDGFKGIEDKIFKTSIRRNVSVHRSQGQGKPLLEYDKSAIATKDYESLTDELIKRMEG